MLNKNKILTFVLLLALSFSIAAGNWAPALADAHEPSQSAQNFEIKFMQDMINHHMMAVMEAEICLEKAVHEELRMMCEEMLAAQSQEIEMMQAWLMDWYGIDYMPEMHHGMMKMMEKLAALEGEEFEIEFMQSMIKHHSSAVREAEKCLRKAFHEDLLMTCQEIIEMQTAEIEMMQAWLCEWYGICKM